jgi:beta-glucosidase
MYTRAMAPDPAAYEDRVESLLARCTLEEKLALLGGTGFETVGVPRLGVPRLQMADGPAGLRGGKATAFVSPILAAATFDSGLIQQLGAALGREAKAHGKNVLLAPCVNLVRVPHGGRNFESFGEDPYLAARSAVAYIRGVQSEGVIATVKHFAANNQETERTKVSVAVSERVLHELYLSAFEASVKEAGVWAVMGAYNRVNGTYACDNRYLLGDVLKRRWGFPGLVMSDWGATHSAGAAVRAGLDLDMPGGEWLNVANLQVALERGELGLAEIDDAVRRQLRLLVAMGHLDRTLDPGALDTPEHRALNRQLARSGFVLLENRDATLPLKKLELKRLAVVGPRAVHFAGGGGSAWVNPTRAVSLLDALGEALGPGVKVDYAPGILTSEDVQVIPAEVLSPPPGHGEGPGLLGEYFRADEQDGAPRLSRVDAQVDFSWWNRGPVPDLLLDQQRVVWRGQLTPPRSGRYALGFVLSGHGRLFLDGELVIEHVGPRSAELATVEVELVAGRAHELRLEQRELATEATVCSLRWLRLERDLEVELRSAVEGADAAIVCVGHTAQDETEGRDMTSLELPPDQVKLIRTVAALHPRTIVVLTVGTPVLMGGWRSQVPAVLLSWFCGQEGGYALADVLLGDVSPSGKLPVTFPRRWEDCPAYSSFPGADGVVRYDEGVLLGYRWFDTRQIAPEFAFGHGLSYTRFAYRDLVVDGPTPEGDVHLGVTVTNVGSCRGAEVVQVYVHPESPPVPRPDQELKAFAKVDLLPGEAREVSCSLGWRAFAHYDALAHHWVVAPGAFELRVGSSSRDIRLSQRIRVGPGGEAR